MFSNKWVRQWIAIGSFIVSAVFTTFALWGQVDMDVYWKAFGVLNGYIGWFFISREVEKRSE